MEVYLKFKNNVHFKDCRAETKPTIVVRFINTLEVDFCELNNNSSLETKHSVVIFYALAMRFSLELEI